MNAAAAASGGTGDEDFGTGFNAADRLFNSSHGIHSVGCGHRLYTDGMAIAQKQIANFFSECLVLGVYNKNNEVVLLEPSIAVDNGDKIG